ncbi:MAG: hypothetical protein LBL59_06700 [Xanthomonadaceae bacterium]|jgi:hypothetical protein|nr:hypothetical protein [Xanthomonadaceae bacterium]
MPSQYPTQELRQLIKQQHKTIEYLQKVVGQLLTYEQYQKQHSGSQSQKLDRQIISLTQAAQSVTGNGQRLVSETVKGVEAGTKEAIATAAQSELEKIRVAADKFIGSVRGACSAMDKQQSSLDRMRKTLLWKLSVPLVAGSLLCVIGGGGWLWLAVNQVKQAQQQAEQAQMQADLVRAINASDIQLCGDKLCVNIDSASKHIIGGKTYYTSVSR